MWCFNCQHGHEPNEAGYCPCCGAKMLEPELIEKVCNEVCVNSVVEPEKPKRGRPRKKV